MTWKTKFAIAAGVVLLFTVLGFIIWYQHQTIKRQEQFESQVIEMRRLQDGVVRAQASYVSKDDLKAFAKDNGVDLKPIQEDLKLLNAEIRGINKVVVVTPGYTGTNLPSTNTKPRPETPEPVIVKCPDGTTKECPNTDPFGYNKNTQELKVEEPFINSKVPFGNVKFSAWRDKPWDISILPREYSTLTVLSTDDAGRHFVHNKLSIKADGKSYTLPVNSSEFVERYPESVFRFDPSLYLGVDVGALFNPLSAEITPNLQLFLFSYGQTKINPSWIFLGFGLGYETQANNLGFLLSPASYNLGNVLPIIDNLYIGPSVSVDLNGGFGLLGGVRVGL